MDDVRRALEAIEAARRGIGPVCVVAHYYEARRRYWEAIRSEPLPIVSTAKAPAAS
jgi:hypothetical protein